MRPCAARNRLFSFINRKSNGDGDEIEVEGGMRSCIYAGNIVVGEKIQEILFRNKIAQRHDETAL
jgi:hypothetical protein